MELEKILEHLKRKGISIADVYGKLGMGRGSMKRARPSGFQAVLRLSDQSATLRSLRSRRRSAALHALLSSFTFAASIPTSLAPPSSLRAEWGRMFCAKSHPRAAAAPNLYRQNGFGRGSRALGRPATRCFARIVVPT